MNLRRGEVNGLQFKTDVLYELIDPVIELGAWVLKLELSYPQWERGSNTFANR